MANNPYKNKVVYNGAVLIDLTEDTVTADTLVAGYTAHDASGKKITGTAIPQTGGGAAVTITDTDDSHGGIIRSITGVDISNDTVTADKLLQGYTAHDASGNAITGQLLPGTDVSDTTAVAADVSSGKYFYTSSGVKTEGTLLPVWTFLGSTQYTVNTTSTTATSIGTYTVDGVWDDSLIIYVRVRDKAGKRTGYFYGSDCFFINYQKANSSTSSLTVAGRIITAYTSDSAWYQYSGSYGVYAYNLQSAGKISFRSCYHDTRSLTINGTYKCDVYSLKYPDGKTPFNTLAIT